MLLRLSIEERVIGIGSLAVLLSVFVPWYTTTLLNSTGQTETGFSGDLGVVGFVVFLLTLISLAFLIGDSLGVRLPRFGLKKENIMLFLNSESAFLLLLVIAIFTKRSLEFTNAEIRFGLYMALIGSILSTFAAFAQLNKLQKKAAKAFFEHEPEETAEEAAEEPAQEGLVTEEPKASKSHPAKRHQVVSEGGRPVIQELFFEEEKAEQAPIEADESEIHPEETMTMAETVTEPEPSMAEEIEKTNPEMTETPVEKPVSSDQGNYFLRDANIESNVKTDDAEKPEKKGKSTSVPANQGSGFYNDL